MPGQNLTREEAKQRSSHINVVSYDVILDLTQGEETFKSVTTVKFTSSSKESTFIDLIAEKVNSITLNGNEVDINCYQDSRICLENLSDDNELIVDANCYYMHTGEGLHRFVDKADGEAYVYSQFEVADSRRMFAVFEQPDLKSKFRFTVTTPKHWIAFSNSPTPKPVEGKDSRTFCFEPTDTMSSYITALVAGPYKGDTGSLTSSDGRQIPLGVYCRASMYEFLDAEEIMDITKAGFKFYEKEFDYPYPFAKYDQIFIPEFNAGAMENAGCVTYRDEYVFRSKPVEAIVERRAITILHELAHMWFGDLVTMKWWNDLWLNESFAEFMSTLCTAEATRWTNAWTTFNSLEKNWAYRQDQLPSTHPISANIRDLEDVEVNFDGITYAKGASVLKQLVAYVGREAFFEGIKVYFKKHAWKNTELTDLLSELEKTSGRDLSKWTKVWLEESGVNLMRPVIETDSNGVITHFGVQQEAFSEGASIRPHRLVVAGYDLVDCKLERSVRAELDIDSENTTVSEFIGKKRPNIILINDEDLTYSKVRMDEESLAYAVENIDKFTSTLPRSLVLSNAWDMVRDGEFKASDYVDLVLRALEVEEDSSTVRVLLRQLGACVYNYSAVENRGRLQAKAFEFLKEKAKTSQAGGDIQLQCVKALTSLCAREEDYAFIRKLLGGCNCVSGLVLDQDLRWQLLIALAEGGCADENDIKAELDRDNTVTGNQNAECAFASFPSKEAKDKAWNTIMNDAKIANDTLNAIMDGFLNVTDRSLIVSYYKEYFNSLEEIWKERTIAVSSSMVETLFPVLFTGMGFEIDPVHEGERWLDTHKDAAPALRRVVSECLDDTKRVQKAQQFDA
ncbi:aminopeptidase N [Actinomyces sp. zg-332]|uniref:aminopeptidase N n=1 Tax=Actinomyces sp. zg-332 TaxID=2708340 RepID=UPI00142137C7|nr:aminopeptidase N [Actinomyces sp. zg-332]QPK94541.1 aminopeptidase N [Actinomyces sp. zg-332]